MKDSIISEVSGVEFFFGGGRNLDFKGEQVQEFGLHAPIQSALDNRISEILDLKTPPKIDMRWSGIMGFTKDKRPHRKAGAGWASQGRRNGWNGNSPCR